MLATDDLPKVKVKTGATRNKLEEEIEKAKTKVLKYQKFISNMYYCCNGFLKIYIIL